MSLKARMRPTWRKGSGRSGLPTPPGFKFMTIAQRRAAAEPDAAKAGPKAPKAKAPKAKATTDRAPKGKTTSKATAAPRGGAAKAAKPTAKKPAKAKAS